VKKKLKQIAVPVKPGAVMVVAGVRFAITSAEIAGGTIAFVGERPGPVNSATGYLTIFGSDGQGVLQSPGEYEVPAAPAGDMVEFRCQLQNFEDVRPLP
jgi:hypothetical protein